MIHHLASAAHDHALTAVVATVNALLGVGLLAQSITAAEVNDGLLTGAIMFILATAASIIGWSLILLVKLTGVVSRLETTTDDHERRLNKLDGGS